MDDLIRNLHEIYLSLTFEYLKFHYPETIEIIKNPYFLYLFGLNQKPKDIYSDIGLLTQFVNSKVLSGSYMEQKSKIINSFFEISQNAKLSTSVEKKDLPEFPFFNLAYNELISSNVLYEYTVRGNYHSVNTYVKFTNDILLGFFLAKSDLGQFFYFESFFDMDSLVLHSGDNIDFYLENKHSVDALIRGHFLKFMQYFLAEDNVSCKKEYELFQKIEIPDNIQPKLAGYYFGAQAIYQSVFFDKVDSELMDKIYKKADFFYQTGIQSKSENPIFEPIIMYSLNFGNKFEEICSFMELMLDRFEMVDASFTWQNQLSKIIYARALLNTGKIEQAFVLNQQCELKVVPENHRNYVTIRFNLIKAEFLIYQNKNKEAKMLIEEIKTLAYFL